MALKLSELVLAANIRAEATDDLKKAVADHSLSLEGWDEDEGYRLPEVVVIVESTKLVVAGADHINALRALGQDWIHEDDACMIDRYDNICKGLATLAIDLKELNLDPANARKHGERNLDAIKTSLTKYSQRQPVVVQKNGMVVRAGNARVEAARALGWTHVAALVIDEDDLTATLYGLMDNKSAELAEWDNDVLFSVFSALTAEDAFDIDATGFFDHEIDLSPEAAELPELLSVNASEDDYEPQNKTTRIVEFSESEWALVLQAIASYQTCGDVVVTAEDVEGSESEAIAEICREWFGESAPS